MADPRELLEAYVRTAKVMQLATLDGRGDPYVNNLWFASMLRPDRLYFISRPDRLHCEYVREHPRVAGAILAIELTAPDQKVRGVTFTGTAVELPREDIEAQIGVYAGRWPQTATAIDPVRMAAGETHHRLYEIQVLSWVLYDEENFKPPRQPVDAL